MLKLFRSIRQKLLIDHKITQYLLYVIGEVFLVVVGILIALYISDWTEQQKNKEAEKQYYSRILEEFRLDELLIEEMKTKADERIQISKELLLKLHNRSATKTELMNGFLKASRSDNYEPHQQTYNDLQSSGNMKLLTDLELKNTLIQYYNKRENRRIQINQNRDEIVREAFATIKSSVGFGSKEFDYVRAALGEEIYELLPSDDWLNDPDSEGYRRYQMILLFEIAMADREKQHLSSIQEIMAEPKLQLLDKLATMK